MRFTLFLFFTAAVLARATDPLAIDIDLASQKAFLLQDGKIVYESPISSGRPGHLTPTGEFQVLQKDDNHLSTLYGRIVDTEGKVLTRDADAAMPVPKGAKFVQAPMKHFLRFNGATGMHTGYLPGYPASHGCVRMPDAKAELFYSIAEVGTPVHVHGTPPAGPAEKTKATATKSAPVQVPLPKKWWQIFASTAQR